MQIKPAVALDLVQETVKSFVADKALLLGAALAYYTVFSLAPLLLVAIAISGLVFGQSAARGEIVDTISSLVGTRGAEAIEAMILAASKPSSGWLATVVGIFTLLLGATGVFGQLQDALNLIWKSPARKESGIKIFLRTRLLSFALVLGIAFLLLVSLLVTAALAAVGVYLSSKLPGGVGIWHFLNFAISFAVITVLFAMLYKVLPDREVHWRDVWVGSAVTAFLFGIGKFGIGLYLGKSGISSAYGAAGSFAVLLVWIYYSAQIFLFGAEFTKAYAYKFGSCCPGDETLHSIGSTAESHRKVRFLHPRG